MIIKSYYNMKTQEDINKLHEVLEAYEQRLIKREKELEKLILEYRNKRIVYTCYRL